jgi:hypothetical protein
MRQRKMPPPPRPPLARIRLAAPTAVVTPATSIPARGRGTSERYRATITAALLLTGLGAGLLAATSDAPTLLFMRRPPPAAPQQSRIGKIVLESTPERCRQMIFDNDTGRITPDDSPCDDGVRRDVTGTPMPMGTVQRLEAISKAFSR